jgi:hypothetical protein
MFHHTNLQQSWGSITTAVTGREERAVRCTARLALVFLCFQNPASGPE